MPWDESLQRFYEHWDVQVRLGKAGPLDGTDTAILRCFLEWVKGRYFLVPIVQGDGRVIAREVRL